MSGARWIAAAAALACLGACALPVLPPLLEAGGHGTAASVLRAAFHPLCHQIPERSFALAGAPMAVCARCTGLHAGFLAGCLAFLALALIRRTPPRPPGRLPLVMAAAPTALEWTLERSGVMGGSPGVRALLGALLTFTIAFYFLPALGRIGPEMVREYRRFASPKEGTHAEAS